MLRVFSKKALEFKNHETGETKVVKPLSFDSLPEWAENDPMFGWAKADGVLEVIETAAQQKVLENDPNQMPVPLESLTVEKLKALAQSESIELPKSANKPEIIDTIMAARQAKEQVNE